jgi:hypothetical protein
VEVDSVNGVRQIKFRTPGDPLKICTAAGARREAETVEQNGELGLANFSDEQPKNSADPHEAA